MINTKVKFLMTYLLLTVSAHGQPLTYTPTIKKKIHAVENNLVSWVQLDSTVNWNLFTRMKQERVNGLSIAVIDNFEIQWAKSYGFANTETGLPVHNSTLFQSASIGKSIHAFAIMRLVQDGRVDLDRDINDYLKRWKFPYSELTGGKPITLRHILSHSAGLSVHGFDGYKWGQPIPSLEEIIKGQQPANNPRVESQFPPGERFQYSGGGYEVTEMLVEDVTGLPYAEFILRNVFEPLQMKSSTFALQPANNLCATGYRFDGKDIGSKYHLYPEKACGAGLWSTALDIARFVIEMQRAIRGNSSMLNENFARTMITPVLDSSNSALGCFIERRGEATYFQHSGLNEGFSSQYYGSVEGGRGVVVVSNSDNIRFLEEIVNSVATVYGWRDFYPSVKKKIVRVREKTLSKYIGQYVFDGVADPQEITMENGTLFLRPPGSPVKWQMYFTSETEFFMLEAKWAGQQFFFDDTGKVGGHYILGHNYKVFVRKVQ